MNHRWRSFWLGVLAGTPCLVVGWFLFSASSAKELAPPTGRTGPVVAATAPETAAERRIRLDTWVDTLNASTPEESWTTKAPSSPQEAEWRLKAMAEARELAARDLLSLLDREMSKPTQSTIGTMRLLIGALAHQDPEAALRWMKENLNRSARWDLCWRDVGRIWALNDPKGFSEWFRNGKAAEYREEFNFSRYVGPWVALRDVGLGAELIIEKQSHSVTGNDGFAEKIITPEDVAAVRAVLERQPPKPARKLPNGRLGFDGSSNRDLQRSLETAWPAADPEGWKAHLETHPLGAYGEDLWLEDQVKKLGANGHSTTRAEEILAQLPADADREAAVLAIVRTWSAADPQAAVDWAAAITSADDRERLVSTVARALLATDPGAAVDLWQQLPESPRRNDRLADAFDQWHANDPAAAEAFRQTTNWSKEVTQAIRERLLTRPAAKPSIGLFSSSF